MPHFVRYRENFVGGFLIVKQHVRVSIEHARAVRSALFAFGFVNVYPSFVVRFSEKFAVFLSERFKSFYYEIIGVVVFQFDFGVFNGRNVYIVHIHFL